MDDVYGPPIFKPSSQTREITDMLKMNALKNATDEDLIKEFKSRNLVEPNAFYDLLNAHKIKKIEEQIKQLQLELCKLTNPDSGSPW